MKDLLPHNHSSTGKNARDSTQGYSSTVSSFKRALICYVSKNIVSLVNGLGGVDGQGNYVFSIYVFIFFFPSGILHFPSCSFLLSLKNSQK